MCIRDSGYSVRSTEINAVIGRSQLKRLDANNGRRRGNFETFLELLDPDKYFTKFDVAGSCNFGLVLILKRPDDVLWEGVLRTLRGLGIEFRRGTTGGGNQLRQPYLQVWVGERELPSYPKVDHVHFYGLYIGNYPDLNVANIQHLCERLNALPWNQET